MKVVEGVAAATPRPRVVALGTFDGVHLGHRSLIDTAVAAARERGITSTVATFDPMPLEVLRPEQAPSRLSGIGRRAVLIAEQEPDELLVIRFDRELSLLEPDAFVAHVLAGTLDTRQVVVGVDYRFGHRAAGDVELLTALGVEHGFEVTALPLLTADGERVSSSWIRELVAQGEVAHASRLLGRDPWIDGVVVRGHARGRELGMPTANLAFPVGRLVPAIGIYAGHATLSPGDRRLQAAISVGRNVTFGDAQPVVVEAHLLDFDEDVYGSPIRIEFRRFLRHELRFESVSELVEQMWQDVADTRAALA